MPFGAAYFERLDSEVNAINISEPTERDKPGTDRASSTLIRDLEEKCKASIQLHNVTRSSLHEANTEIEGLKKKLTDFKERKPTLMQKQKMLLSQNSHFVKKVEKKELAFKKEIDELKSQNFRKGLKV